MVGRQTRGSNLQESWGWRRILAGFEVDWAAEAMLRPVAYRPEQPLPALAAVVPAGFGLPSCLIGRRPVLLPVPAWEAGWPLAGAVALLERLLAPQQRKPGKIPRSEMLAEIVALAREALGDMLVVMDAVTWLIPAGPGGGGPVVRNLLLAGMIRWPWMPWPCVWPVDSRSRYPGSALCQERGWAQSAPTASAGGPAAAAVLDRRPGRLSGRRPVLAGVFRRGPPAVGNPGWADHGSPARQGPGAACTRISAAAIQ